MTHKVKSHRESFDLIISKLQEGNPFTFTRFGDGDYIIMYPESKNRTIGASNRFLVTESLQRELKECHNIKDDNFLIGTILNDDSKYSMSPFNGNIDQSRLDLDNRKELLAMSTLQEIFLTDIDKFVEFPREMRKTNTMLVGGYNHEYLSRVYGPITEFVETPKINSYESIDKWLPLVYNSVHKVDKIVLMSGFSSRVVAKRLWGLDKMVIDVGSLSDMLVYGTMLRGKIIMRRHIENEAGRVLLNGNHILQLTRHWNKA